MEKLILYTLSLGYDTRLGEVPFGKLRHYSFLRRNWDEVTRGTSAVRGFKPEIFG